MLYRNVCVEGFTHYLPDEVVTSDDIEARLAPLYQRLKLPEGRLELITSVRERRIWPKGTMPGEISAQTVRKALDESGIPAEKIGCLVHGSVCRDYLEPATASGVHRAAGLPDECVVYDVSNACLGLLNGMIQIANMIELGQIEAGVVVGTENSRPLLETTIDRLNADMSFTRKDIKRVIASLTIGSASAAVVLCHKDVSRKGHRLLGGEALSNTNFCHLCRSDESDAAGSAMQPLMWTDSETLMHEGIALAKRTFDRFLATLDWTRDDIARTFCHQVGKTHSKILFEALGLDPKLDFTAVETLGNTGSAALPSAAAIGIEQGAVSPGDNVALLGIGSGINVVMLGIKAKG